MLLLNAVILRVALFPMSIFRDLCNAYYQCRNGQSGPDYAPIPPPPHPTYDLDAVRPSRLCPIYITSS